MTQLKHIQELRATQHKYLVAGKITKEEYISLVRPLDQAVDLLELTFVHTSYLTEKITPNTLK